jgi:hypothetical protein
MPLRKDMVVSDIRDLIAAETGARPEPDADGDLPVRYSGALFYTRVTDTDDPPVVQVFSVALADVARATDAIGRDLAAKFGGRPVFEESKTEEYEVHPTAPNVAGPYL